MIVFGCNHTVQHKPESVLPELPEKEVFIEEIPLFEFGYSIRGEQEKIAAKNVGTAMAIFYLEWHEKFGDKYGFLLDNLDHITILWSHETQEVENCFDIHGNHLDKATVSGLAHGSQLIWVWSANNVISDTSLVHELVHVGLMSIQPASKGDADHEGNKIPGWTKEHTEFIDKVNGILKEYKL